MKNKINITAKTAESFKALQELCDKLHPCVSESIEEVRNGIAMPMFKIHQSFTTPVVLNIPNDIISIRIDANRVMIACRCGSFEYPYKTSSGVDIIAVK